ncbi:patatin-like phospholipase family protein [Alteribacillus iranensis]|uniref:NTE family protein n=1 Tax=Alteribacillus iranensis TaxID=930128 RepID=A0A1I2ABY4_9BACI|nr:patatin-like phospholipase family protein [Alteribacillus iranensis]SFE41309.1 NTE family protein [Alteribacillus iranensis]
MTRNRPRIGVALGAGGVKGFAHIGVLEVLLKNNIPIDMMTGSSMGGLIAALYGAGQTPGNMSMFAKLFKRKFFLDFTVPRLGLIQGERVRELVAMLSKNKQLEEMNLPIGIVATDLESGEAFLFKSGPASEAVRASISIPGIFVPVRSHGTVFVDGGVADLVPVRQVKELGADLTIAIDVSFYNTQPSFFTIYDVIVRTMDIMGKQLKTYKEMEADILIKPITKYQPTLAFENTEELIESGRIAAEKMLPDIKKMIKQWKETDNDKGK